jgi:hypothetical protein
MKMTRILPFATGLGVLAAASSFAQAPSDQKQHAQDGSSSAMKSGAVSAEKQKTQGSLPMVGPASGAYKHNTQGSPPMVGPASGAYKQNTQSLAHSDPSQAVK